MRMATGSRRRVAEAERRRVIPMFLALLAGCLATGCDRDRGDVPSSSTVSRSDGVRNGDAAFATPAPAAPAVSLAAVRGSFNAGRFGDALDKARSYLVAHPGHPEALMLAGRSLMAIGNQPEAIATLRLVPGDEPKFGMQALGQIAEWHLSNGFPDEAEAGYRRILELHGDIALAHSRVALLMNSQGKRFEALPHLRKLAAMQDITQRELGALVTIGDQCGVQLVPGTTGTDQQPVRGDLRRARQMGMTARWDEGRNLARRLREAFPDSTAIAAFLGVAFVADQDFESLGQWKAALPDGTENQPEYWSVLAHWSFQQGKPREAIRCSMETLRRDPTRHSAYETMAKSLLALDESEAARAAYERYERLVEMRTYFQKILGRDRTGIDYLGMAERTLALNRPLESLGWLKVAARSNADRSRMAEFQNKLQSYTPPDDFDGWLLCGLATSDYPLPGTVSSNEPSEDRPGTERAIVLTDVAAAAQLDFQYDAGNDRTDGSYLLHHTMGGGIGVVDFDHDGHPDLYFSQGGGDPFGSGNLPNRLFRNLGGSAFGDVTAMSGSDDSRYGQGVTAADFNQDGFVDLIVANIGPNSLLRNNGDGTFTRADIGPWQSKDHWTSHVAAADLSGDGIPELVECNYIDDPGAMSTWCTPTQQHCAPGKLTAAANRVVLGTGDGSWSDWPAASPIAADGRYSLGVMITDMDGRPGNELFIANDTVENTLWSGKRASASGIVTGFTEEARLRGCATGPVGELLGCMGIAAGDFDRNGTFDMYVTNYYNEPSNLYLQISGGLFVDRAAPYRARKASRYMVGFGTQAADLDRDGWLDLVVLNGHAVDRRSLGEPLQMQPQLFRGRSGRFDAVPSDAPFWSTAALGRTLALVDWNGDGRTDMVANHLDQPSALLQNESTPGQWIRFELVGTTSERDATGANVTIRCEARTWTGWVTAGDGYYCSNQPHLDFGVDAAHVDGVTVDWPSGRRQELTRLECNQTYLVVEGTGEAVAR